MTEARRNFAVGLFVIVSLVVTGTLMVWFGEVPDWIATSEWTLRIAGVKELNGIGDGTPVNLVGIRIGRVKTIEFRDTENPDAGVVIVARIRQQYSVPHGAHARVYGSTFGIGSGRIDIMPQPGIEPSPLPKDEAVINGEMRSVVGEIIKKEFVDSLERTVTHIGDLAEAAKPVMDSLSKLIEPRSIDKVSGPNAAEMGLVANFATIVERIDKLVANVNAVLGDEHVQEDVKVAVRGLKQASEDLRATVDIWRNESQRLAENVNTAVDETETHLDDAFGRLNQVLGNLDNATSNLVAVSHSLTTDKGTAGLLINDPRLYESAVLALDRLSEVLLDLKTVTGRMREDGYITVGLAPNGFPQKRIPVGGDAKAAGNSNASEAAAFDRAVQESQPAATMGSFPP